MDDSNIGLSFDRFQQQMGGLPSSWRGPVQLAGISARVGDQFRNVGDRQIWTADHDRRELGEHAHRLKRTRVETESRIKQMTTEDGVWRAQERIAVGSSPR